MMKLGTPIPYLKKIKKYINHVTHTLCSSDISIFSPEISRFFYIKKYRYRLHFDTSFILFLALFRMGFFGGSGGAAKRFPLPKICLTYPAMMKLGAVIPYLKKIQKIYESRDTFHKSC